MSTVTGGELGSSSTADRMLHRLNTITKPLSTQPKAPIPASTAPTAVAEQNETAAPPTAETAGPSPDATPGESSKSKDKADYKTNEEATPVERLNPTLPPERLSAVVKPLSTAISSKGFQNTLSVAANLAHIDGARDVISESFKESAETASRTLLNDLDALLATLPPPKPKQDDTLMAANEGTSEKSAAQGEVDAVMFSASAVAAAATTRNEPASIDARLLQEISAGKAQTPALASLASPSSAQAVFLRSLRALDYLLTGK